MGTKLDLARNNPDEYVTESMARKVCKQLNGAASLQCSALNSENVDKVFHTALKYGLRKIGIKVGSARCEII